MPYVYSTITASQAYTLYGEAPDGGLPPAKQICIIAGGSNTPDKHFITPRGVVTQVTDEQLRLLNQCPAYLRHKAAGYLTEDKVERKADVVAKEMKAKDGSAPKTPEDFQEDKKPITNKKSKRDED